MTDEQKLIKFAGAGRVINALFIMLTLGKQKQQNFQSEVHLLECVLHKAVRNFEQEKLSRNV